MDHKTDQSGGLTQSRNDQAQINKFWAYYVKM